MAAAITIRHVSKTLVSAGGMRPGRQASSSVACLAARIVTAEPRPRSPADLNASREDVRDWMYRHQLDRRNLDPKHAAMLRGLLHEERKQPKGGNDKAKKGRRPKSHSETLVIDTASSVATDTGVSPQTVKRDAEFARAVTKLDADGVLPKSEALKPTTAGGPTRKAIIEAARAVTRHGADSPSTVSA